MHVFLEFEKNPRWPTCDTFYDFLYYGLEYLIPCSLKSIHCISFIINIVIHLYRAHMSAILKILKNPKWPTYGTFYDFQSSGLEYLNPYNSQSIHCISFIFHMVIHLYRACMSAILKILKNPRWPTGSSVYD